ncbi:Septum site-determining protein MinC [Marinomonas gallaica]|uniref:Probable septum site-determining protein MinC n=1 Tax=Marinomonas gallaica TaxID=1806667 RepID=A0A1C3JU06_9GAMM|nr:septum site-determining protein MinC [Marinomonas gallaica]SBT18711.1 Septum site-determining protein MinC [Marinomonas gallaica]SBT21666.1 Septum site-determining protein MinC [Marinomonas gallaica]
MSDNDFRLKGSVVTTVVLEVKTPNLEQIKLGLKEKIAQVPQFFNQAPLIIDINQCSEPVSLDLFQTLVAGCRELGLAVIGWRTSEGDIPSWRFDCELPLLPNANSRQINIKSETPAPAKDPHVVIKTVVEEREVSQPTKLITKPVRSGQQVYAPGDLVVVSQVSAGAEVLAEGNIHIYGALRGRALAGVKGDTSARIFCKNMEAELVAIAGNFMLSDALQKIIWKDAAQVLLVDEALEIASL